MQPPSVQEAVCDFIGVNGSTNLLYLLVKLGLYYPFSDIMEVVDKMNLRSDGLVY